METKHRPNRLKEYRVNAGLTQKEVSKLMGLNCEDRICRWEQGSAMPGPKNLIMLANIYGIRVEEMVEVWIPEANNRTRSIN